MLTDTVHHLPDADYIIALGDGGIITEQGSFKQLRSAGGYVQDLDISESASQSDLKSDASSSGGDSNPLLTKLDSDAKQAGQTGDWEIYKYYFGSLGIHRIVLIFGLIFSQCVAGMIRCG
jgi:ATP-binding cassette, subfamily C (CFTR/MRP), member 1